MIELCSLQTSGVHCDPVGSGSHCRQPDVVSSHPKCVCVHAFNVSIDIIMTIAQFSKMIIINEQSCKTDFCHFSGLAKGGC